MRYELTTAWRLIGQAPLRLRPATFPSEVRYLVADVMPTDAAGTLLDTFAMAMGDGNVYARADHPASVVAKPPENATVAQQIAALPALPVPAYMISGMPLAALTPYGVIRIIDNPQGQAESNGVDWISTVDGSNLGPGHG